MTAMRRPGALRRASVRALPACGTLLLVALVATTGVTGAACQKKPDAAEGRDLYATTCARCHGGDGTGGQPIFDGGSSPRNFHERAFQNERTDEQIKLTIINGKGSGMPSYGTIFDEQQLGSLVAHLRSLGAEKAQTK